MLREDPARRSKPRLGDSFPAVLRYIVPQRQWGEVHGLEGWDDAWLAASAFTRDLALSFELAA